METKVCTKCQLELPITKFRKLYKGPNERGTMCHICNGRRDRNKLNSSPERRARYLGAKRAYREKWPFFTKICGYQAFDRANGYRSLTQKEGRELLGPATECSYCGNTNKRELGLDRRDNHRGHDIENVVVCCELCNVILIDLPAPVKDLLAPGLRQARTDGLLANYVVASKREMTRKKINANRKSI